MAEEVPYPLEGILLSALQKFVEDNCNELQRDYKTITTAQFCQDIILPLTKDERCSLVSKFPRPEVNVRKTATIFISHAWSGKIWDTLTAVDESCEVPRDQRFVWLDCFCVNQHEVQTYSTDWYSSTFHNAIRTIGKTCLVLTPVLSPTPLRRSWCLWEIYGSISTRTPLTVCVPPSDVQELIQTMKSNFLDIMKRLSTVDAANADAFKAEDRQRIKQAVENTVGFERINEVAIGPIRNWLLRNASDAAKKEANVELYRGLGLLQFDLGRIDEAYATFQKCLDLRRQNQASAIDDAGKSVELAVSGDLTNLGSCCLERGDPKAALRYYEDALAIRLKGAGPKEIVIAYNNRGLALKALRNWEAAMKSFDLALQVCPESVAPEEMENAALNRAECQRETGDPSASIQTLKPILDSKIRKLGPQHVSVAQVMNLLGQSLLDAGKIDEAETMIKEALRIRQRVFGKAHPRVALCVFNLAKVYLAQRKGQQAAQLLSELLEDQVDAYGPDHFFVQNTKEMMQRTLSQKTSEMPTAVYSQSHDRGMVSQVAAGFALPQPPPTSRDIFEAPPDRKSISKNRIRRSADLDMVSNIAFGFALPQASSPEMMNRKPFMRELSAVEMSYPTLDDEIEGSPELVITTPVNQITEGRVELAPTRTQASVSSDPPQAKQTVRKRNFCIIV